MPVRGQWVSAANPYVDRETGEKSPAELAVVIEVDEEGTDGFDGVPHVLLFSKHIGADGHEYHNRTWMDVGSRYLTYLDQFEDEASLRAMLGEA